MRLASATCAASWALTLSRESHTRSRTLAGEVAPHADPVQHSRALRASSGSSRPYRSWPMYDVVAARDRKRAAVHWHLETGDEARLVGRQEQHGVGDVPWVPMRPRACGRRPGGVLGRRIAPRSHPVLVAGEGSCPCSYLPISGPDRPRQPLIGEVDVGHDRRQVAPPGRASYRTDPWDTLLQRLRNASLPTSRSRRTMAPGLAGQRSRGGTCAERWWFSLVGGLLVGACGGGDDGVSEPSVASTTERSGERVVIQIPRPDTRRTQPRSTAAPSGRRHAGRAPRLCRWRPVRRRRSA